MAVWFTSDWHFGHRNILTLGEGRPFASIEEHDEELIYRHNMVVGPDDEVWVLGDVAMGNISESLTKCGRMSGRKILVCGNHDRTAMTADPIKRAAWTKRYMDEGGFSGVILAEPHTTIRLPDGRLVWASHYPYAGDSRDDGDRYLERRPVDQGEWLLHGHVHHQWRVRGRMVNVGVDAWGYAPVAAVTVAALVAQADRC